MLTLEQKKAAKAIGFLPNRETGDFSARVISENGVYTSAELENIAECAKQFGSGTVALTSRMTMEIQHIKYENIQNTISFVAKENLVIGGTGAKVRPITCCKGTVCVFGNIDTQKIGEQLHKRVFEGYKNVTLPHKFKIAVGGCPNNCIKPDLNDIGLVGVRPPVFDKEKCKGCSKCAIVEACPMKAATLKDNKMERNDDICNRCGRCINKCYFKLVTESAPRVKIYIGGRWGKKTRKGTLLSELYSVEEGMDIVEKTLLCFKENAFRGERFAEMIERIGEEKTEKLIKAVDLNKDKDRIINSEIKAHA